MTRTQSLLDQADVSMCFDSGTLARCSLSAPGTTGYWGWLENQFCTLIGTGFTAQQLVKIMPQLGAPVTNRNPDAQQTWTAEDLAETMNAAMHEFQINLQPQRMLAFVSQIAEESCELLQWEESPPKRDRGAQARTEEYFNDKYYLNASLGNTEDDDGYKFRGRGPLQLTGRDNYQRAGRFLKLNLEENPDLVATDRSVGFRASGWFWQKNMRVNPVADKLDPPSALLPARAGAEYGKYLAVTQKVNGGVNGADERWQYYLKAVKVYLGRF